MATEIKMDEETPVSHRSRTINIKRLSKRDLQQGREEYPETETHVARPRRRLECMPETEEEKACGGTTRPHAARPCPFVSCKHHLYLDVNEATGSIKLNFPHLEVEDMPETCAADIADRGDLTLEEIGVVMNLTRERIRQLETRGFDRLRNNVDVVRASIELDDDAPAGPREYDSSLSVGIHGVSAEIDRATTRAAPMGVEIRLFPRLVEHIAAVGGTIRYNDPGLRALLGAELSPRGTLHRLAALGYGIVLGAAFVLDIEAAATRAVLGEEERTGAAPEDAERGEDGIELDAEG